MKGRVIRSTGSWYDILSEKGEKIKGRLRGKFKIHDLKVTNPIAVGDIVEFEKEENSSDQAIITEILPRKNYLIRKAVQKSAHGHLIASNIDQTVLIVTLTQPVTSRGFIDRFLVSTETFRIPAVLVFNKTDLYSEDDMKNLKELEKIYSGSGYKCIRTSAEKNEGLDLFKDLLHNNTSLLSGHSGVGKSTLVNKIAPHLNLKTAELSSYNEKGKHTTTFAEMFEVNKNSYIIDTPGIKELGLFEIEKEELSHYFPEMRELLGQCKFHNCIHINEPSCAVKEKLAKGEIAESRYASYLKMLQER
jgi:ribosome biogenesis GTPase